VWSVLNGWEMPDWFAPGGVEAKNDYGWRRTRHAVHVEAEVAAVRNAVGLVEMTPMTKFEARGPQAAAWLDSILANRLPEIGRIRLCHALNARGGVIAEYAIARLADDWFYLVSTPRAQRWNFDDLRRSSPPAGVSLSDVTDERGCFTIVGPRARDLLQPLTEVDLSNAAFPWLSARTGEVGFAGDVRLLRINYEGELGWELYHPLAYQRHLLSELLSLGAALDLRLVGLQALESLRLDKSYRAMSRDINPELSALESGLDRFVSFGKGEFVGRAALIAQREKGLAHRLVTLAIESDDASVLAHEGVYREAELVGRVTSGGYSYTFRHDIALALLPIELTATGTALEVPILGVRRAAKVIADSPYDPQNLRPRM
jgi:dimethylglycine dehydrogenase